MRTLSLAALSLVISAGAALAASPDHRNPAKTIQCIDVSGRVIPARCNVPGSRLDRSEYICLCPAGGDRVEVAVCADNQKPPPESAAFERVRRKVSRDGSLIGDSFEGRPICTDPRLKY